MYAAAAQQPQLINPPLFFSIEETNTYTLLYVLKQESAFLTRLFELFDIIAKRQF